MNKEMIDLIDAEIDAIAFVDSDDNLNELLLEAGFDVDEDYDEEELDFG